MAEITFGGWLKHQRNAAGWTQEQLARQIHCSTSALRKFESEERRPSAEVVEQIAEIFNIRPEERKSFLRFVRGDWMAMGVNATETAPWHKSTTEPQSSLPSPISSFIGREKEQTEIMDLLGKNRLVTLAGPGGIGKTRLAIQVGYLLQDKNPDGVWFIPLDSLSEPSLVPQTVASIFEIREGAAQPVIETLKNVLRRKTLLLILDNCEHLLEACAQLINSLLIHCPHLKVLATSRETINLTGEAIYYLPSLSTPQADTSLENIADCESVQLFIKRAGLALSTFQLTKENAQSIVEICRRVDGIPLALELTAARVNILKVDEISRQLHNSFAMLISEQRNAPSRHQTLQASLDWSWSLLSHGEQVFLGQLSVFAGGWTLEAAGSVCDGNALSLTNTLVQKSLIKVEREGEPETRFHLHEMVRQYAQEKLKETGDIEAIRDRHLAYFVKLVEEAEPELYRSNQVYWLNRLDDDLDNLRAVLKWAIAADVAAGLRISAIPWRFWQRHHYQEAGDWANQLLEQYSKSDSLQAQSLAAYSTYLFAGGKTAEARRAAEQGLHLARILSDRQNEALCLLFLGRSISLPGNYNEGDPILEQSLAIYRILGNKIGQAMATGWLGLNHNDLEYSNSRLMESLVLHRDLGNLSGIAWCLGFLAYHAVFGGDFSSPTQWLEEARTLYHQLGDQPNEADILQVFGMLAHWQGSYQQACIYFEQAITLYENAGGSRISWPRVRMGHSLLRQGAVVQAKEMFDLCLQQFQELIGFVYTIEGLAALHMMQGDPTLAVHLFSWADAIREKIGDHRPPVEQVGFDKDLTVCLTKMGEIAFSDAYEEGKKMSLEEAIAYALEES